MFAILSPADPTPAGVARELDVDPVFLESLCLFAAAAPEPQATVAQVLEAIDPGCDTSGAGFRVLGEALAATATLLSVQRGVLSDHGMRTIAALASMFRDHPMWIAGAVRSGDLSRSVLALLSGLPWYDRPLFEGFESMARPDWYQHAALTMRRAMGTLAIRLHSEREQPELAMRVMDAWNAAFIQVARCYGEDLRRSGDAGATGAAVARLGTRIPERHWPSA